ncbi:MAG: glycine cleavage system protein GcvH [Algisphaera sp.]
MEPEALQYAKSHEWVALAQDGDDRIVTVGLSAFALETLTDLVFMDLPDVGLEVSPEDHLCDVESVKAVSEVYSPVAGVVVEVNEALPDQLETIGDDPYGASWICKIRLNDGADLDGLLDHAAYLKACADDAH